MDTRTVSSPAYEALAAEARRLHRLQHLQSIVGWDQAANMPPKGSQARAEAMSEMAALLHRLRTDPRLPDLLKRAQDEPLAERERANLREIERQWRLANAVPESLVQARMLAGARCEHAWRAQRPANDWAGFLGNFREVLSLAREEARVLADASGQSRYEALMDRFEPGMTTREVDRIFGAVRQWLPALIERVVQRQSGEQLLDAKGPFPKAAQRALSLDVMQLLGFDFDGGRLDESTHPFSGGVPEDVRLTTRYREDDFVQALMGTIHETGHARYEQNLPRDWVDQPLGEARSMAIHESQSLAFEMQLARSRAFVGLLAPLVTRHLGAQPAFEAGNLHRMLTRVRRGYIRVDADEVTYPAHVILRYEIERALVEGEIEAEDIPALWDAKMQELLGVDTRGNYTDGPLQDIHWTDGAFGYFPSYTLGAMYAAQWFATMRREHADLDARIARGDLGVVFEWLRERIWLAGSRWSTQDLSIHASGGVLDPAHFRAHLESRYLGAA